MSIYKRGTTWWARFTAPDGQRVSVSCRTANRTEAQEFHDKLKAKYWRTRALGEVPDITWEQAVVRWLKEQSKKTLYNDKSHFRLMEPFLLGRTLKQIDRTMIDGFIKERLKAVQPATVNRSLEVLRAVLNRAEREWGWLERAPSIRLLREPQRRIRWITQEQASVLLDQLPQHIRDMARFTLCTGLREANVTGLQWSQVDLNQARAWIHPDQAKAGKALAVPLNREAIEILKAQVGKHHERVFTFRGEPVLKAGTKAWRAAVRRAGIDDFRWHDLRHTWASWHVQRGTPLHALQELGGWESYEMVRRYAHLSADHLADYAMNGGTNLVQLKPRKKTEGRKTSKLH